MQHYLMAAIVAVSMIGGFTHQAKATDNNWRQASGAGAYVNIQGLVPLGYDYAMPASSAQAGFTLDRPCSTCGDVTVNVGAVGEGERFGTGMLSYDGGSHVTDFPKMDTIKFGGYGNVTGGAGPGGSKVTAITVWGGEVSTPCTTCGGEGSLRWSGFAGGDALTEGNAIATFNAGSHLNGTMPAALGGPTPTHGGAPHVSPN